MSKHDRDERRVRKMSDEMGWRPRRRSSSGSYKRVGRGESVRRKALVPGVIVEFRPRGSTTRHGLRGEIKTVDGEWLLLRMLGIDGQYTGKRRRVAAKNVQAEVRK